jgi:hypothetical protein
MRLKHGARPGKVHPFPAIGRRALRRRSVVGAVVALIAIVGSLAAATLGPALEESYALFVLLMLTRG